MRYSFFALALQVSAPAVAATKPQWVWTQLRGGAENDEAYAMALADDGSFAVAGRTSGAFDDQDYAGGLHDFAVMKFSSSGCWQWTQLRGSDDDDRANGVAIADDGGVVVVGNIGNTFDQQRYSSGNADSFMVRFSQGPSWDWTRVYGTSWTDQAHGIAIAADGSIVVVGYAGSPRRGEVVKFSSAGEELWRNNEEDAEFYGVAVKDGGIAVVGSADGDLAVAKFSSAGELQWKKYDYGIASEKNEMLSGIAIDDDGGIVVTGRIAGSIHGQQYVGGDSDIVVMKFSASGGLQWTRLCGSTKTDIGSSVAIAEDGGIVVVGSAGGSINGENYAGGEFDIVVVKFSATGEMQFTLLHGTAEKDCGQAVRVVGSAIFVAGYTSGYLDNKLNKGKNDIAVVKFEMSSTVEKSVEQQCASDSEASYIEGDFGQASCPHGFSYLTNEDECLVLAANVLGRKSHYKYCLLLGWEGCAVHGDGDEQGVYYSSCKDGEPESSDAPVCKKVPTPAPPTQPPTSDPTPAPPTSVPTQVPTPAPPTPAPTSVPTPVPPTSVPTPPTPAPTAAPTAPTPAPTAPTPVPTSPTPAPTAPTPAPTAVPTSPTTAPTAPTLAPTDPTPAPTEDPTLAPTDPTSAPTAANAVLTRTQSPVVAGSVTVQLEDITGIGVGDEITLSMSGTSETKTVTAVAPNNGGRRLATGGTVVVDSAFVNAYPAGAQAIVSKAPTNDSLRQSPTQIQTVSNSEECSAGQSFRNGHCEACPPHTKPSWDRQSCEYCPDGYTVDKQQNECVVEKIGPFTKDVWAIIGVLGGLLATVFGGTVLQHMISKRAPWYVRLIDQFRPECAWFIWKDKWYDKCLGNGRDEHYVLKHRMAKDGNYCKDCLGVNESRKDSRVTPEAENIPEAREAAGEAKKEVKVESSETPVRSFDGDGPRDSPSMTTAPVGSEEPPGVSQVNKAIHAVGAAAAEGKPTPQMIAAAAGAPVDISAATPQAEAPKPLLIFSGRSHSLEFCVVDGSRIDQLIKRRGYQTYASTFYQEAKHASDDQSWKERYWDNLAVADVAIVLKTLDYFDSKFCKMEYELIKGKQRNGLRIIEVDENHCAKIADMVACIERDLPEANAELNRSKTK